MDFSVQNICGFLMRSRLLSAEAVKAVHDRWQTEAGKDADDKGRFMRWLVAQQYVTEYQSNLLARGLPDNFFLGDYKILDRLGTGGMAGVYKAAHALGQVVAVKVLPPSRAKNATYVGRFQREARLALKLKHPNIVRAFQIGESEGLHYIAMEYLEGETLDEVLRRRGKLPPAEAVRLVYQALLGLQHIHEQGLIHRDMKPSNLMLVPAVAPGMPDNTLQATVKILDIGLGRALFDESVSPDAAERQLTTDGVLLGTPDYLAPEQARNAHSVDIRADIYSLGCVLYNCLAGQPPFPDANVLTQMIRHLTETPRPLPEFNAAVPDGLAQIVGWMMAKNPEERYPTPERAAQALQVFLAAGAAPRAPESDPKTRLYLSWLDQAGDGSGASPMQGKAAAEEGSARAAAAGAVTSATPPGAPPPIVLGKKDRPARPQDGKDSPAKAGRRRKKSREPAPPLAKPVSPQTEQPKPAQPTLHKAKDVRPAGTLAAPAVAFDVELVPVARPAPAAPPAGLLRLSRRDLIMLGTGAGGCGVAIGLGYAVARLVGLLTSPSPPEE
jgi:serine/threonine protein kinase